MVYCSWLDKTVQKESKAMSNTTPRCFTCGDDAARVTAAAQRKTIQFHQHEYDMFLDGRYVGSRATHKAAEDALDVLAYEEARRS